MQKLHAACDECRTRKLKCSGARPVCGRCSREKITCVYSPQKTMGRPRKRRREEEEEEEEDGVGVEKVGGQLGGHGGGLNGVMSAELGGEVEGVGVGESEGGGYVPVRMEGGGLYEPATPLSGFDFDTIDPSLWDTTIIPPPQHPHPATLATPPENPAIGPCPCLSLTYLTLTDLQTVPTFSFPQVIIPLRKAMRAVASLLNCPTCPLDVFSAIQNVSALVSLFKAIVSRFSRVLHEVDSEAARLREQGARKPYRIGDNDPALSHLHTGTLDCPMGFNIELEPGVWKTLVKTALRTEMDGGGSNPMPLMRLLRETEERQVRWHAEGGLLAEERRRMWGREDCERGRTTCEGLGSEHIRRAIGMLDWE